MRGECPPLGWMNVSSLPRGSEASCQGLCGFVRQDATVHRPVGVFIILMTNGTNTVWKVIDALVVQILDALPVLLGKLRGSRENAVCRLFPKVSDRPHDTPRSGHSV